MVASGQDGGAGWTVKVAVRRRSVRRGPDVLVLHEVGQAADRDDLAVHAQLAVEVAEELAELAGHDPGVQVLAVQAQSLEAQLDLAVVRPYPPFLQDVLLVELEAGEVHLDELAVHPEAVLGQAGLVDAAGQVEPQAVFAAAAEKAGPVPEGLGRMKPVEKSWWPKVSRAAKS